MFSCWLWTIKTKNGYGSIGSNLIISHTMLIVFLRVGRVVFFYCFNIMYFKNDTFLPLGVANGNFYLHTLWWFQSKKDLIETKFECYYCIKLVLWKLYQLLGISIIFKTKKLLLCRKHFKIINMQQQSWFVFLGLTKE